MDSLVLLSVEEFQKRLLRLTALMGQKGIDATIISDFANQYYLTGRVFSGYIYIPVKGLPVFFVKRPVKLEGDGVVYIRKPEEMAETIVLGAPATLALELDTASYSAIHRLSAIFPEAKIENASAIMRTLRAVKTDVEQQMIRESGIKQEHVYRLIPHLYQTGMSDLELQVELERRSRLEGCLGQFRISGDTMELYMGNVLTGDNADAPTPYDFAMGGRGLNPSLPVGCDGSIIEPGHSVMVDMNGDYTGYMTDMTRTFSVGALDPLAVKAHKCSIDIVHALAEKARPSVEAKELYRLAETMAAEAGLKEYFMGHRQKAGFVGHGLGIEINELPVIAPRSRDIIADGNVIAFEPKFVIPGVGAVGIENTYIIHADSAECVTSAPEELIDLQ